MAIATTPNARPNENTIGINIIPTKRWHQHLLQWLSTN